MVSNFFQRSHLERISGVNMTSKSFEDTDLKNFTTFPKDQRSNF